MATYTRRVQAVLSAAQYRQLERLSRTTDQPISVLVRRAVERAYLGVASHARRRAALGRLFALEAPVASWARMEADIAAGAEERARRLG